MRSSTNTDQRSLSSAAVNEETPLLASASGGPATQTNEAEVAGGNGTNVDDDKPLAMGQIFLLCIARLADPISMFSIFPFVPAMVKSMDVAEEDVGFYTGLIESLFSVMQMITMIFWGRLSDRYGRKPILVASMFGVAVCTTLFGISRHIWQMILFRCIAGAFSGSVVTIRAMFSEHSTPKTQARAFSYFSFAGYIGIFAGPAIGALARPADQYPDTFGKIQFFRDWPYLLPTAIAGGICAIAFFVTLFFVKETLKPKPAADAASSKDAPMTTWQIVKSPGVPITLLAFSYAFFLGFGYTAMSPVYYFTSIPLGGYGLSERLISLFVSLSGISQAIWLLLFFPPIQRRTGTKRLLQLCGAFWPVCVLLLPLNNFFLRRGWVRAFWGVAMPVQVLGAGVAMAFTGVQLALNDAAPSAETLGTLNGIALTANSAVRAFTPTVAASVYAWGVKNGVLGGQFGIVLLAIFAALFFVITTFLPAAANDKPKGREEVEEEVRGSS